MMCVQLLLAKISFLNKQYYATKSSVRQIPEQHRTQVLFGDFFYSLSKLNCYLRPILQRINRAVIVVDGNAVDHSVPQLFVKLYGRCFKLCKLGEHTTDGYGLGFHSVAPCGELFVLFLLGGGLVPRFWGELERNLLQTNCIYDIIQSQNKAKECLIK